MTGISRIISAAKSADTGSPNDNRAQLFSGLSKARAGFKGKGITITSPSAVGQRNIRRLINGTPYGDALANAVSGNMGDAEQHCFWHA